MGGVADRLEESAALQPGGGHRVVDTADLQGFHHQLEALGRRGDLERDGVGEVDLARRHAAGAELVLETADPHRVGAAVLEPSRHQIEAEPGRAVRGAQRARGRQGEAAIDVADEPFQAVQPHAAAFDAGHGRGRADIAAAMVLGRPGAAGQRFAVAADELMQVLVAHRRRGVPVQHVGHGRGHGHRAMQGDVRLREQVAHRIGDGERGGVASIVEPDHPAPVGLARDRLPGRVVHHLVGERSVAAVAPEQGRPVAVGVFRRGVDRAADPRAERRKMPAPSLQGGAVDAPQDVAEIGVGLEEVEAAGFAPIIHGLVRPHSVSTRETGT